ncbi:hypothetical protein Tco_1430931 [Tanacetum coccineum]
MLTGPTYDLIKATCKSVVELEYHLKEVFKATNDQLDWHNPEGRPYPHDLSKPLPLILDVRGRLIIPYDHFINNDLEYLKGGSSSRKYTTSITKTKAADYGHVKWIEDKIPRSTWSERFYGYATNLETSKDVYSKHRIIAVTSLKIMEFFGYKHLEEITVRRQDDVLYKFREGDFKRLRREHIKDMLLLLVQERVEDLQLAVESYQKKINLTKPDTYRIDLRKMTPYTLYHDIQGIIYLDDMDKNRLMRTDELYKFSDGTLNHVRTSLNDIATGIQMEYLRKKKWTKQDKQRAQVMIKAIDKKLKYRRLMRSLEKFVGGRPFYHMMFLSFKSNLPETEWDLPGNIHRFYTSAENPVKEILLKLNLPDHRKLKDGGEVKEFQRSFRHSDTERLSRSDEVLKLKNFKKDATLKLFKSTNQERYEHVGPKSQVLQDGKVH